MGDSQDTEHGSLGKAWLILLETATPIAQKWGWQQLFTPGGSFFYHHEGTSHFQWELPDDWAAVRYVRYQAPDGTEIYKDFSTTERLSGKPEDAVEFEIVDGFGNG